ncbi:uncharacterized protein LOC122001879 [Zingiber officinale]|uniref:uncharacterized protein LOC122001879 n=1 Tax=Zingiber officinale TaxID=94328 RepID=UPI001C4D44F8|nr:uncharacterized protein LOC122001879 [Zingiber officinale]
MRIRKQAAKMMMGTGLSPPPPPPPSSFKFPTLLELMESKQEEGSADYAGKAIAMNDEGEARDQAAKRGSTEVATTCRRSDGKRWQCRNAAVDGHPYCEHHLSLLRSRTSVSSSSRKIKKAKKEHKFKKKAAAAETWNSSGAKRGECNGGDGNEIGGAVLDAIN